MTMVPKPPDEASLEHFGVKGMRWGVRKKRPDEAERKARFGPKAKKAAAAAVVVGGAAVAATLLAKHGNIKIKDLNLNGAKHSSTILSGKKTVDQIAADQAVWKKNVKAVLDDIAEANREQDAWMRKMGLGQAVNQAAAKASKLNLGDIDAVRRAMDDPNHVWDL